MLAPWHEFYALLGTAASALVALLFVAVSIGIGFISSERQGPTRTFTSPVLAHYTYILFVSLLALAPLDNDGLLAIILGISAGAAFLYSAVICVKVLRSAVSDHDDRFAYGVGPPAAYGAVVAAAYMIGTRAPAGPALLAAALIFLLLVNIRNAWDLTVFFVQRRTDGKGPD
jgi:hypothetical protein